MGSYKSVHTLLICENTTLLAILLKKTRFDADWHYITFLLWHEVVLPDHLPSSLHDLTADPNRLYPTLQESKTWEPNNHPHEREAMVPYLGALRTGQDLPVHNFQEQHN